MPLVIYSRNLWPEWWIFLFAWRDIKRQNISCDLLYYLSLKRYITVNHSGQNYLRNNETTAIAFQSISVIWHLATPFSIYIHNRSRDLSYQHLKPKVSWRCYVFILWPILAWRRFCASLLWLFSDFMQICLEPYLNMLELPKNIARAEI